MPQKSQTFTPPKPWTQCARDLVNVAMGRKPADTVVRTFVRQAGVLGVLRSRGGGTGGAQGTGIQHGARP